MDWVKDLWATASVAIHDYVTTEAWNKEEEDKFKIDLQTDPLAYLEILVDVLQEWDRYTVQGESAFSEKVLLQSYETQLNVVNEVSSYFASSMNIIDNEEHLDVIGINSISDIKLLLTYPYPKKKQEGMKDYKKELKKNLNRMLKDWNLYVVIEENDNQSKLSQK